MFGWTMQISRNPGKKWGTIHMLEITQAYFQAGPRIKNTMVEFGI